MMGGGPYTVAHLFSITHQASGLPRMIFSRDGLVGCGTALVFCTSQYAKFRYHNHFSGEKSQWNISVFISRKSPKTRYTNYLQNWG